MFLQDSQEVFELTEQQPLQIVVVYSVKVRQALMAKTCQTINKVTLFNNPLVDWGEIHSWSVLR